MRVRLSKPVVIVTLLVTSLAISGIAFAYWTTTGSGTGSATTGTAASVVVKQTGTPTGLYPGGSSALSGTFDNPNSGAVFVTAVTASVTPFSVQADTGEARVHPGRLLDHRHRTRRRERSGRHHRRRVDRPHAEHDQQRDEPGQLQVDHRSDHVRRQLTG